MQSTFTDKLAHRAPMLASDVSYNIVNEPGYRPDGMSLERYDRLFDELVMQAVEEVRVSHGIQVQELTEDQQFANDQVNYFLFGLIDPTKTDERLEKKIAKAKATPNSRVNLALIYRSDKADKVSELIPSFDKQHGVNSIYQDNYIEVDGIEYLTISMIDIADNMVCETFRVKYHTQLLDDPASRQKLEEARDEVWNAVQRVQHIYTDRQLWHRSPTDGAFMFLTKHGWLTTCTRTPKNDVKREDMSLILDFNEDSETITYAGDRLPSSDLPEFLVLIERNEAALTQEGHKTPVIRHLVHFHKNEITRKPLYTKYGVPFYRYGVSATGHKFADELLIHGKAADGINIHGKGRGFIILEHGLVRIGVELDHFEQFLDLFDGVE